MASTYTLNNGIELIGTGEQSGTWGDTTNTNLELIDTALDGQISLTLSAAGSSGSPNALPVSDGASSNGRNRLISYVDGSDLGATAYVQLTPNDAEKIIYIRNALSGSRSIIVFQGTYNASNDYEIPAGTTAVVYFNGGGTGAVAANVFNNAYFDGLRLGSVSVTAILDEDNMASNSATALSTQQSIKAYVDSQVGTVDTLAEILANGNTTGGTDLAVSTGDDITFADSSKAIFGAGSDLEIYHDGSNSYITDNGTGNLRLKATSLRVQSASGNSYLNATNGGSVDIFYNNSQKLATTSTGIDVTGNATFADDGKAIFGAGSDLQIFHSGTESFIREVGEGGLKIDTNGPDITFRVNATETALVATSNGAVTAYYDNSPKLATTATGIQVTGNITNASGDFTIDVAGDITLDADGADVLLKDNGVQFGKFSSAGGTDTFNINSIGENRAIKFFGNDGGSSVNALTLEMSDGGTARFSNDIKLLDNGKAIFGAGSDLQIYHDGSNNYVDAAGVGHLYLQSQGDDKDVKIQSDDGSGGLTEYFRADGSIGQAQMFHYGNIKLATTATGIDVTGAISIDNTTGSPNQTLMVLQADLGTNDRNMQIKSPTSDSASAPFRFTTSNSFAFEIDSTSDALVIDASANVGIGTDSPSALLNTVSDTVWFQNAARTYGIGIYADDSNSATKIRQINSGGSIKLATGSGGANEVIINSSGKVGIGTDSPSRQLEVQSSTGGNAYLSAKRNNATSTELVIGAESGNTVISSEGAIPMAFYTNSSERMRIDSSGNLLVGKTVNDLTTQGTRIRPNALDTTRASSNALNVCRTGTDGSLAVFYKDSSVVGNIGTLGNYLTIGDEDTSIRFHAGVDSILPHNSTTNAARDASINLGASGSRFKDLYLSGTAYADQVGISQTSPTALLHVGDSSNSLGGTAGNSLSNLTLQSDTSNTDSLVFTTERTSTGTTWTSAAHKIQRKVDAVEMGYMQFGNNTTDLITFGKADTEFVRINSSGRVGINTSGPTSLFHIVQTSDDSSGGLNIRNTAGTNSVFIYQDGTQTNFDSGSSGTQAFKTQNIDRLNISQGGLIGINQPTPTARLHVNTGTTTNNLQGVLIEGSNSGIATGPDIALYRNSVSPADSDNIGAIHFYGNNGADEQTHYAMMFAEVNDVSDGSEDASIVWSTMDGGTLDEAMRIDTNRKLLVGKDASNLNNVGVELDGEEGRVNTTANSTTPLLINRTGTEGALVSFRYGNVARGFAHYYAHGFQIQGESGHSGISFAGNAWIPLDDGDRVNNLIDLGHTSYKFDDVYATNPNIQTSDRNEKQDIESLTATEMLVAARLSRLFKTFRWKDAVAKKGNDARTHTGTIAQDVQAAFTAEGLDAGDYALFISSTWWEHLVDVPAAEASEENGTPAKDAYTRTDNYYTEAEAPEGATEKTRLGLRYSELLAFVAAYNEQRFASIEARLTALEG